ncbi:MAG: alpha/beta hydrolase [Bacteroidota bacterium]|nr:alpha/beta hydrolase [Bacteroidota bacterium]
MPFIFINNNKINYHFINKDYISENSPILLFLHEGLGSIEQWNDFPALLSKQTKLPALLYDRYGHGKSEKLKEKRKVDYLHTEAFEYLPMLLKKLKINNKLILFGHSDGGSIALLFASKFKNKTAGIITEAAHVFVEEITLKGIEEAKKKFEIIKLLIEKYHGQNTEPMFYNWADRWLSNDFRNWNIENDLKKITCPALAIQGKKDKYGTKKQVESIVNNINKNAKALLIPNCGHNPHLEKQEYVLKKTLRFIEDKVSW